MTILTGTINYASGAPVNGLLLLELTQAATVNSGACGGPALVGPLTPVEFGLTDGEISGPGDPPYTVYGLDCLTPAQGIYYRMTVLDEAGGLVFRQLVSISGNTFDLGDIVPPTPVPVGAFLGGDCVGPALANEVRRIRGNPVIAGAPTDGQGYFWSALNSRFELSAPSDIYATRQLDNLTATAVNADINPDSDGVRDLGADALPWKDIYTRSLRVVPGDGTGYVRLGPQTIEPATGATKLFADNDGNLNVLGPSGERATLDLLGLTGHRTAALQDASGTIAYLTDLPSAGLPVVDTTELVKGSVDATKRLRIEVDTDVATGTTAVLRPPTAATTFQVARIDAGQTFAGVQRFSDSISQAADTLNLQEVATVVTLVNGQNDNVTANGPVQPIVGPTAPFNITTFVKTENAFLHIINRSAFPMTITDESNTTVLPQHDRILCPGAVDYVVHADFGAVTLWHDSAFDRWMILENIAPATSGYDTVEDEGTPLTQRSTINFVGAGVSAADSGGVTTVTVTGTSSNVNPASFSGLVLWLKADAGVYKDAGSTLAINGDTVQQWNDQSGNGNNVEQSDAARRPTYNTGAVNSLPELAFSGATTNADVMQTAGNVTLQNSHTMLCVVAPSSVGTTGGGFIFMHGSGGNVVSGGNGAGFLGNGQVIVRRTGALTLRDIQVRPAFSLMDDNYRVAGQQYLGSAALHFGLDHGVVLTSTNGSSSGTLSGSLAAPISVMGIGTPYNADFVAGKLCEMVVYTPALPLIDALSLVDYLVTKWQVK